MEKASHKMPKAPTNRTVFWLAVRNENANKPTQSFWDYQTVRFMAKHGSMVVMNGPPEGENPELVNWRRRAYDWKRVTTFFGKLNPKLPVLMYSRATHWEKTEANSKSIAGLILGECSNDVEADQIKRFMVRLPSLPALPGAAAGSADGRPVPALLPTCADFPAWDTLFGQEVSWSHFLDIGNPGFQQYLGERLELFFNLTGVRGLAFDGHIPNAF